MNSKQLKIKKIETYLNQSENKKTTITTFDCFCNNGEMQEEDTMINKTNFITFSILCKECKERYGVKFNNQTDSWDLEEKQM